MFMHIKEKIAACRENWAWYISTCITPTQFGWLSMEW